MKVLVCGSRHLTIHHWLPIQTRMRRVPSIPGNRLIHGAAPGADTLAERIARGLGWEIQRFPADWKKHGKAAGPIRNRQMLTEGEPDLVLAFHTDPKLGRGTRDMVNAAKAAGVRVEVHILPEVES